MEDGQHRDFVGGLVNNIDNDIRRFYQLSCPFAQAGTPDVRQAGSRKPVDARQDPPDESGSGLRIVLRNPVEDVVEIARSAPRGQQPSQLDAPRKPLLELIEGEPARVRISQSPLNFGDLFIGKPIGALVRSFHQHQYFCRIFLALFRPGQHAIQDGFHLFFAHGLDISEWKEL